MRNSFIKTKISILIVLLAIVIFSMAGCNSRCSLGRSIEDTQTGRKTVGSPSNDVTMPGDKKQAQQTGDNSSQSKVRQKLASASLLTDELTGKGEISIGDSCAKIKKILANYEFSENDVDYLPPSGTGFSDYRVGGTVYKFENDKLVGIWSAGDSFQTTKGLKVGDTVKKMKSIYGAKYKYTPMPSDRTQQATYDYTFKEGWGMLVFANGNGNNAKITEIDF